MRGGNKMFIQLAWRNLWRNPRRTLVILMAVTIGVWSMILSSAFMRGITEQMVRNGVATLTGHIQIHQWGYRDDPTVEKSIKDPAIIRVVEAHLPPGSLFVDRVRVYAVASNARHAEGVTLVGIDPEAERRISFIASSVTLGKYLHADEIDSVLVGKALMDRLETQIGRKLIVTSQNMQKGISSRAFRISGVFRAELEATERQYVFVTLPAARDLLQMEQALSEVSVVLSDRAQVEATAATLGAILPSDYEIHSWKEMLPLVTATLRLYEALIYLWYLVAFVAMGFGIVNTILMAVLERTREFGLVRALGMKPRWIVIEVVTESLMLIVMGLGLGNCLGLFFVAALSHTGIDPSRLAGMSMTFGLPRVIYPVVLVPDAILVNVVIFALGLLASVYPAVKASRFTPVQAMAHT